MTPRFCTRCGAPLEWRRLEDERHPQPVCTRCRHIEWQNPKPTASALVTRQGPGGGVEVLLVRRATPPCEGCWDCPGGFVDADEHPEDAVRREVREEVGVEIEIRRLIGIFMDRYGDDGTSTLNIYYEASVRSGKISPGSDASEAAWFPLDGLPESLAFDNNRQALAVLAARSGGEGGPWTSTQS